MKTARRKLRAVFIYISFNHGKGAMSIDCVLAFSIIQDKGRDIENHTIY